ncbi:hypothetical protein A5740_02965 [Mycobacterium sp. GA-1841]|nr:hypothetical protein A5740_02965 [Mycobacterium sp. GA-1841]
MRDLSGFEALAIKTLGPLVLRQADFLVSEANAEDPTAAVESLFFAERTAVVEGRDDLVSAITTAINEGGSLCLTGPSGVGKSAVWCTAVQRLRNSGHQVAAVPIGASADTTSERAAVARLAAQLGAQIPDELNTTQQLRKWWRRLTEDSGDVVIAVDATDTLDEGESRDELGFLTGLSDNVRLLVSTTDEPQFNLLSQTGTRRITVDVLPPAAVAQAAAGMARALRRELPSAAIASLASQPRSPLWVSLAVGELMALDEDDFATVDPTGDAVTELANLVIRTVERLPETVDGVVGMITARAGERFDAKYVGSILRLLTVSRSGLTPSDLATITGLPDVMVAGLKRAFAGMIEVRGAGGRLGFTHGAAKAAVDRAYLSAEQTCESHAKIAQHLGSLRDNDPIRKDDALWHALHCAGTPSAGPLLNQIGDTDSETGIRARRVMAHALANGIDFDVVTKGLDHQGLWILLATERSEWPEVRVDAFRHLRQISARHARRLHEANPRSDRSIRAVGVALSNLADVEARVGNLAQAREIIEECLQIMRSRCSTDPTPAGQRDLSVALRHAADVADKIGDSDSAMRFTTESLEISRNLAQHDAAGVQARRDVAVSLLDVGGQAHARGDSTRALDAYAEALQIWREQTTADPDDQSALRDMSVALNHVGEVARQRGTFERARDSFDEALEIRLKLLRANPGTPQSLRDVSVSLTHVGELARSTGDIDRSDECFAEALRIARQISATDPSNTVALRDISVSLGRVGQLAIDRRDWNAANAAFNEALQIRRQLFAHNPNSSEAIRDVAVSLGDLARVAHDRKDWTHANDRYVEALKIWRQLHQRDPANVQTVEDLLTALMDAGQAARNVGDLDRASSAYAESVQVARQASTEKPGDAAAMRAIKLALDNLGETHRRAGRLSKALETCEESVQLAQAINDIDPGARARRDLWASLTLLGRAADQPEHAGTASASFKEALDIARELHAERPTANTTRDLLGTLRRLGQSARQDGDTALAAMCHREASELEGT